MRYRGIEVFVDSTELAEYDILQYSLPDLYVDKCSRILKQSPLERSDIHVGPLRARKIGDYDILFTVDRMESSLVVTIGGYIPHVPETLLSKLKKIAAKIGLIRGATGL